MHEHHNINLEDYRYVLPKERIALYPLENRDLSKLLVMNRGDIKTAIFNQLSEYLPPNTLLLFNNTRVIRARMLFRKETGAGIELFFLNPVAPSADHEIAFGSKSPVVWECIIGNARKWKGGELILRFLCEGHKTTLKANLTNRGTDSSLVSLEWTPGHLFMAAIFEAAGHIPLPPYIARDDEPEDVKRYQTVYAKHDGSVAAPTAGLHFTPEMLSALKAQGIPQETITLHVGAGTFKPVSSSVITDHVMHREDFITNRDLIHALLSHDGPIFPVGTTSVRSLESLYWYGMRLINEHLPLEDHFSIEQWEPYRYKTEDLLPAKKVFEHLLLLMDDQRRNNIHGSTSLIIMPGYKFAMTNGLITNFHQPGSTLLLLVAALIDDDWKKAYRYAMDHAFRFLSYGDACLFFEKKSG